MMYFERGYIEVNRLSNGGSEFVEYNGVGVEVSRRTVPPRFDWLEVPDQDCLAEFRKGFVIGAFCALIATVFVLGILIWMRLA